MGKTTFNNDFFDRLGHSSGITALLLEKGEQVAANFRANARVDTGEYRNSVVVSVKSAARRNVVLVTAMDDKAMVLESEDGALARALRSVVSGG
ncbi:hypothetical protein [Pseudarthrobacter sp. PS3-L1]|uniref:hypothetical protein n=1 Tax=Pseudarthrobacter sp. PS3-L1 TaxID=3046207 RepID=UPI0024BBA672|nr:hypothetical protein [Pseudarthrobacter sp. PS3-L1]MDJ0321660.1 hypothetical protein [Pseudarthrobacter sp. PS3-L1]